MVSHINYNDEAASLRCIIANCVQSKKRLTHLNLPNFDMVGQLAYPEFENEGKKIPDLTIGLHSYDLNRWAETPDLMLLHDDRVRMFDQKLLRKLEDKGYITPPFCRPGSHGRSVGDMSLAFPFAFWEAKREGGGSDHQSAKTQNAIKVKLMLDWQDKISKSADVPWCPLVWYFVSIGSKWELHGCHFQPNTIATDGHICVSIPKILSTFYLAHTVTGTHDAVVWRLGQH